MFAGLIDDVKTAANDVAARIATRAAIGVIFVVALGFGVAATMMQLVDRFGAIQASWILAAGFMVVGFVGVIAAKIHDSRAVQRQAEVTAQAQAEAPSSPDATSAAAMQVPLALIGSILSTISTFISPLTLLRFIGRNAALVAFAGILSIVLWPPRDADDTSQASVEPAE